MAEKKCDGCGINENSVPYIVYESTAARNEREKRRCWVLIIVLIIALVVSHLAWLVAWNQYDYSSTETITEIQQDGEGINIVGDSNEVNNGANSQNNGENTEP